MAYLTPTSHITSDVIDAATWNQDVVDNVSWLAETAPACKVIRTSVQSITNTPSPHQAVLFEAEEWDVGGMHSIVSNTDRITIPSGGDGIYLVQAGFVFAANSTGWRLGQIYVNDSALTPPILHVGSAHTDSFAAAIGGEITLSSGNYVQLKVAQSSAGNLNLTSAWLSVRWVRAL